MGFGALNTGLSALQAARRGLDTAGQNVANVATEGYSRQRVNQVSAGGSMVPAFFSTSTGTGAGVRDAGTDRLRDRFLEARGLGEHATRAALEQSASTLATVEMTFGEPGPDGLQALLSELWSSFDDVASRPADSSARTQVLERATSLADAMRQAAASLEGLGAQAVEELGSWVADVNATAQRVAELNTAIRTAVNGGMTPNDLMDQRDVLVGRLAELAGATSRESAAGAVDVYLGGTALVRGTDAVSIEVALPAGGTPTVVWSLGGASADVTKGALGGLLQTTGTTVPRYQAQLDDVAARLVATVNTLHESGYDLSGAPGGAFFTATAGSEASTLRLSATLAGQPERFAASGTPSASGNLDSSVAQALAEAANQPGSPDRAYRTMINVLGIESQSASRMFDVQDRITAAVDEARLSASGVNLDEEMAQMVVYQHAYGAAARFVSAIDEALDTLINVVGR